MMQFCLRQYVLITCLSLPCPYLPRRAVPAAALSRPCCPAVCSARRRAVPLLCWPADPALTGALLAPPICCAALQLWINITAMLGETDFQVGFTADAFQPLPTATDTSIKIIDTGDL